MGLYRVGLSPCAGSGSIPDIPLAGLLPVRVTVAWGVNENGSRSPNPSLEFSYMFLGEIVEAGVKSK